MLQAIKSIITVNKKEFSQSAMITAGTGLAGVIILFSVMFLLKPETYMYLGSFIALLISIMVYVIIGIFGYTADFNLAVSMGVTRKKFALGYWIQCFLSAVLMTGVTLLFYLVERNLYHRVFKDAVLDMNDFSGSTILIVVLCIVVFAPVFRMLLGAFLMKFQKVGFWILWAVWMIICLGGSRLVHWINQPDTLVHKLFYSLLDSIQKFPQAVLLALGAGIVVISFFLTWLLIRRQRVTNV